MLNLYFHMMINFLSNINYNIIGASVYYFIYQLLRNESNEITRLDVCFNIKSKLYFIIA